MPAGVLFKGVCYPSEQHARTAACSDYRFSWGDASGNFYTVECTKDNLGDMQICKRTNGQPCVFQHFRWPYFLECDYSGGTDLALDWFYIILPIFALLWGIKRLIHIFDVPKTEL
ncbi:MAG: hypothetical protein IJS09_05740 [Treponema sp.]|nr:hypothetical protein [Treponema sp.]